MFCSFSGHKQPFVVEVDRLGQTLCATSTLHLYPLTNNCFHHSCFFFCQHVWGLEAWRLPNFWFNDSFPDTTAVKSRKQATFQICFKVFTMLWCFWKKRRYKYIQNWITFSVEGFSVGLIRFLDMLSSIFLQMHSTFFFALPQRTCLPEPCEAHFEIEKIQRSLSNKNLNLDHSQIPKCC